MRVQRGGPFAGDLAVAARAVELSECGERPSASEACGAGAASASVPGLPAAGARLPREAGGRREEQERREPSPTATALSAPAEHQR